MRSKKPDYTLLVIIIIMVLFGLIMIASASVVMSQQNFVGHSYVYLKNQLLNGLLVAVILGLVAYHIPYLFWRKVSVFLLAVGIGLLLLVFIPRFGIGHGNASRWLNFGFFSIQPAEFVKLIFIIYLADWFDKRSQHLHHFYEGVLPFLFIIGLVAGLIVMQPDVGTVGVLALISLTMFVAAGARFRHIVFVIGAGVSALLVLIKLAPYRMERFLIFLNPQMDPNGAGYQINQALIALGSGGFLGLGLGQSRQKFNYLPEPIGDSIFAIIGEELGFIGTLAVVTLFVILAMRGLKIAKNAPDNFSRLLVVGIISWFCWQAFINIGALSGILPLTGVPLPFISYGGSALAAAGAGVGILMNISRSAKSLN